MSFVIEEANAETTTATTVPSAAPEGDLLGVVLPFAFIFVIFYFLILRPQQRKFKEHQAMVSAVRRGDKIVTSGGIHGKVVKVDTDENVIHAEIADNVIVKVVPGTISHVVNAEKPQNDNAKGKAKK